MGQKNDSMKKICIYCERWASGGIESFLSSLLFHMDRSACQIDLVASCIEESIFTKPLQELGISFYQLSGSRNRVLENRAQFLKLLREKNYDVLHVNAFHAGSFYFLHLGEKAGIPKRIAHAHNSGLRKGRLAAVKLAIHDWAKKKFVRDATDLWACSSTAAEFMFPQDDDIRSRVRIVPNGIDTRRFCFQPQRRQQVRAQLGMEASFVLGHVGRLSQQKNQQFLLSVLKELIPHVPNSKLLLVGEGELQQELKKQASDMGLADKVHFAGPVSHVEDMLWAMDFFLFPSLFEGLGIAAVEAQAAGLPVLCSDKVPPEAQMLSTLYALPLEAGVQLWAEKIQTLREMPVRREDCAKLVRQKGYDMDDVARMALKLYQGESAAEGQR